MRLLRLAGRSGSALPGLVMERLYPQFLPKVLSPVEKKIILVTGTNGKTTTTKMLVAGLRGAGARVVTNSTGSNMTRGLIAALIEDMTYFGSLKPTDWFVFEMDEAYAPVFTDRISPKLLVALNVLRDQLDRYGEIDTTARLIQETALKTDSFVYNTLDPLLSRVAAVVRDQDKTVISFGVSKGLLNKVLNEQSLYGEQIAQDTSDITLEKVAEDKHTQKLSIRSRPSVSNSLHLSIPVKGFHNALNATAVIATLDRLLDSNDMHQAREGISAMPTPFGRGELLRLGGKSLTVALVKNPSGFTTNLATFVQRAHPDVVLFVVNDKFADGRDVSWLWDVTFKGVVPQKTELFTAGIRGYDMALRLQHDGLSATTELSVSRVLARLMKSKHQNIVIIPTYTALFEVRTALGKYGKVPRIW